MKKIIILCTVILLGFSNIHAQKNQLDQLFDKYQDVEGVTSIKIAKPMFGMLSSLKIADEQFDQIKPLLSKISGLKVLITEGKKSELTNINKEISSYLKNVNYKEIMSVNNNGSKIKFLAADAKKDNTVENLLLNIDGAGEENILVMLDGNLSMDDINKIVKSAEKNANISTTYNYSSSSTDTSSYLNGENRNVGNFSGIETSAGVKVVFTQDSKTSVKVLADSDKLHHIITRVDNGILKVYIDSKGVQNLKFKNLSVNVSSPLLDRIKTSSGSKFTGINEITSKKLSIEASSGSAIAGMFKIDGTSNFNISSGSSVKSTITSTKVLVKCSSGSSIKLEGASHHLEIDASSGASCKADQLISNTAVVESTSASSVSVNVKDKLTVKASSAGSVKYKGNPELESNISKSSAGSLKSMN